MRDRRFEPRHSMHQTAEFSWDDGGASVSATGELRDVSRSGARFRIARPIRLRTEVRIQLGAKQVKATVNSCGRSETGYELGVEFGPADQGILKRNPQRLS